MLKICKCSFSPLPLSPNGRNRQNHFGYETVILFCSPGLFSPSISCCIHFLMLACHRIHFVHLSQIRGCFPPGSFGKSTPRYFGSHASKGNFLALAFLLNLVASACAPGGKSIQLYTVPVSISSNSFSLL